jgi:four helix bundle protein
LGIGNLELGVCLKLQFNNMIYKGYKDLDCYKEARLLRIFISDLVKKFPATEKFLLIAQVVDSSRSVTRNMAEGYGRFTFTDTRNFFIIARGSVTETMEHLTTAFDEKYITDEELKKGEEQCELVFKLTNGYIAYLDKSKATSTSNSKLQNPNSKK